ncbi:hypothetical protein A2U01_0073667 [Trifolium medium]|uniref:Uncharacterized protein n=1 Tax=Trifolium medium TaxID=97028 RepID=A0A392SUB4_9FABA|nr:hypothetical protein [Trifolium medium]
MLKPHWGEENTSWGGTSKIQSSNRKSDEVITNVDSASRLSWGLLGNSPVQYLVGGMLDHIPNA